jgi:hypothetical protein
MNEETDIHLATMNGVLDLVKRNHDAGTVRLV